jgi:hypothetical protein
MHFAGTTRLAAAEPDTGGDAGTFSALAESDRSPARTSADQALLDVSDILGESGLPMLDALIQGIDDPSELASLGDGRLHAIRCILVNWPLSASASCSLLTGISHRRSMAS